MVIVSGIHLVPRVPDLAAFGILAQWMWRGALEAAQKFMGIVILRSQQAVLSPAKEESLVA
jgi:hypothetical protein